MPHDVVLDPTVHHLFAKDRFNRGKSSRSWPLYPRCGHDLSPPRCPPFVEAGTPDLLWLYKSQRKAWKRGEDFGGETQKNRAINPEKQSTQNTTQKKYRVKNGKLEPKQKQKPRSKEIIHREKERKGIQYTQRIVPAIAFISADVPA
ncbi:hypothetical protein POPTR_001G152550v4 [Populus trichocarpa]|jgi:hypothetical protein|uniref:Uncharacterized protein n=1 Tax=Populus trichocarpa TaxID=3694 RepID=A0ACC0TJB0_POPTR|nr:hypothetical protein POPTR_001G152550v4 [Populus trichocarpa]